MGTNKKTDQEKAKQEKGVSVILIEKELKKYQKET
jgi:hypothetical protein